MSTVETATIELRDALTGEEGALIVRAVSGAVGVCVSQRDNGDAELFLTPEQCEALVRVLQEARDAAEQEGSPR